MIGGICLILALLGFSLLPINYVGVILLILAVGLFIAEIKMQGFGILGIGGIVSLILGFLMLVDSPDPGVSVNPGVIWGVVLPVGGVILLLTRLVIQAMRRPAATGREGMAGESGEAVTDLAPGRPDLRPRRILGGRVRHRRSHPGQDPRGGRPGRRAQTLRETIGKQP